MRVLCLNLQKSSSAHLAEVFLKFSPRVQFREPQWIFIDITSTIPLFQSEDQILDDCLKLCQKLHLPATAAISDTPWGAQIFSQHFEKFIARPGGENQALAPLSVSSLLWLEGLKAWSHPQQVEQIVSFLQLIGLSHFSHLQSLQKESFQERWGEIGTLIWKRLHRLDEQVISPFIPNEPLNHYVYLDYPVSLLPFLLRYVEKSVDFLFARLEGRCLFAQKLLLKLRCEYSNTQHTIAIEPATPSRDRDLFMTLLDEKLSHVDLENPIREFEVEILAVPEKVRQLDFWEPQTSDQDKLQRLVSLLQQVDCQAGFGQIQNHILPEKTWSLEPEIQTYEPVQDTFSQQENQAFQLQPAYGKALPFSPRPSRLLPEPQKVVAPENLRLLSPHPAERLEEGWWENGKKRDYYFAISAEGQCCWVFQDPNSRDYFLHGYFD